MRWFPRSETDLATLADNGPEGWLDSVLLMAAIVGNLALALVFVVPLVVAVPDVVTETLIVAATAAVAIVLCRE